MANNTGSIAEDATTKATGIRRERCEALGAEVAALRRKLAKAEQLRDEALDAESAIRAERDALRELLAEFDSYAGHEGGPPYAGSPFQARVREVLA